ncbi:MAG: WD40 repeat domain-containing protein [Synechococcaceae cyanobacterium RL_1_2]|nr:WD40 repeat domain-containing protein [Synechococcaceae cyanobacterium RL_1_2]
MNRGMPLSAVIKNLKPSWKQRKQWQAHRNTITSLKFSRDGTKLLSTSADQLVKVWNWDNTTAWQLEGHRSVVSQGLFGQQQIISASWDYDINVWSEDRQELTSELTGHSGWILAVALSADGSRLVSGGSDRQLKLWDLAQKRELVTLQGHGHPIQAIAFGHQENQLDLLISGDQSGLIKIWHSETYALIATLTELHHQAITAIRCHPHNPWAITTSADATVKLWQIPTGKLLKTLSGHINGVLDGDLCDRGQLLATIGDDHKINLWYLPQGEIMESIFLQDFALTAIALHPQGTKFAIGGKNGQIQLWDYH